MRSPPAPGRGRAAQEVLPTTGGIGAARGEHQGRDRRSRSVRMRRRHGGETTDRDRRRRRRRDRGGHEPRTRRAGRRHPRRSQPLACLEADAAHLRGRHRPGRPAEGGLLRPGPPQRLPLPARRPRRHRPAGQARPARGRGRGGAPGGGARLRPAGARHRQPRQRFRHAGRVRALPDDRRSDRGRALPPTAAVPSPGPARRRRSAADRHRRRRCDRCRAGRRTQARHQPPRRLRLARPAGAPAPDADRERAAPAAGLPRQGLPRRGPHAVGSRRGGPDRRDGDGGGRGRDSS